MNEKPYREGITAFILDNQNNILIVQLNNYKEDEWALPGGGLEGDESQEQALLRELKEELNINKNDIEIVARAVKPIKYQFSQDFIMNSKSEAAKKYIGQEKQPFLINFIGDKNSIKKQDEEIREHRWVSINNLNEYLIFTNQLQTTNKYLAEFGVL